MFLFERRCDSRHFEWPAPDDDRAKRGDLNTLGAPAISLKAGTRIQIDVDEKTQNIILSPITRKHIHSLRGKHKGKGLLNALMAQKKREKEL